MLRPCFIQRLPYTLEACLFQLLRRRKLIRRTQQRANAPHTQRMANGSTEDDGAHELFEGGKLGLGIRPDFGIRLGVGEGGDLILGSRQGKGVGGEEKVQDLDGAARILGNGARGAAGCFGWG